LEERLGTDHGDDG